MKFLFLFYGCLLHSVVVAVQLKFYAGHVENL